MHGAPAGYMADIPRKTDQRPVGEAIALLVAAAVPRYCRTGFGLDMRSIDPAARARLKRSIHKRNLVECKTYFAIRKIEPAGGEEDERWRGDKYGKAHLEALEAAVGMGRLWDRHIVFAPADRAASGRMAEEFPPSKCGKRLHMVDGRDALDDLIRD